MKKELRLYNSSGDTLVMWLSDDKLLLNVEVNGSKPITFDTFEADVFQEEFEYYKDALISKK